ncbi:triose-phosphate isomerase [Streptococcus hongkongensis]|nr:triosephosphate isomerase [Streptococcus uberis]
MTVDIKTPFFIFNPKSYLYGEDLLELAMKADQLANPDMTLFVTGPYADLANIKSKTKNIIVTAQHLDGIEPGRGMGAVLPKSLSNIGVGAVFLNHAEHPLTLSQLVNAIRESKKEGLLTIVCADSVEEAKAIAMLNPDIVLCEPTELIGTGQVSSKDYVAQTNQAIKAINPDILVMQAAGISSAKHVYDVILAGADGTGCTSGIVTADSPEQMLTDMIQALQDAKVDKGD